MQEKAILKLGKQTKKIVTVGTNTFPLDIEKKIRKKMIVCDDEVEDVQKDQFPLE